ncbi:MAG TPA: lipopolysaccharide biosynthesis protein, partial [Fimbriimonas sp.]
TKEEIGYATAAIAIEGLAELLSQIGIPAAIVQRPVITSAHLATGFIVSIAMGLVQTAAVFMLAGPIADALNMPAAEPVFKAISVIFALTAISRIARTRLSRDLHFNRIAKVDLTGTVCYGVVSVVLALLGYGVWSLIAGLIVQSLVSSALLFFGEPVPKPFRFDRGAYRDLMSVAKGFTAAAFLNYIASQGDNLVVGRWMGAGALGVYSRSWNLMARPAVMFGQSISQVLYPTMARAQDDREQLRGLFLKSTTALGIVIMPLGFVMCALAPEVVTTLLGSRWSEVIAPFQVLAAGMFFRVGNQSSDSITRALGDNFGRVVPKAAYALCVVGFAYLGTRVGIVGVAWGIFAANLVHTALMTQIGLGRLEMGWSDYAKALRTPVLLTLLAGGSAWTVAEAMRRQGLSAPAILVAALAASLVAYVLALRFGGRKLLGRDTVDLTESVGNMVGRKLRRGSRAKAA